MANRLANATSPYLRQHADNPVDWREWGPEALAEARERDLPIFLSIGYAACHWCHVMARESFSDSEVAELVNTTCIPIKVDREERPDLDAVYMAATIGLTGQGGWPMSVWLTPEGTPFHAGTYLPPEPRHGLPSFSQVVAAAAEAWRDRREEVRTGAASIAAELARRADAPPPGTIASDDIDAAVLRLAADYDEDNPGFGGAPKFPPTMVLDALLARAAQDDGAVADRAWTMARDTCLAMANGGIHDQLGGGFARYSTDRAWVVPHFEKMLYDNGLLLSTYTRAGLEAQRRGEDSSRFTEVVDHLVDWLAGEMTTPQGAFASSLDADSDDEHGHHAEGAHYVWTPEQLAAIDPDLPAAFRVGDAPSFEHGTSVLQRDPAIPVTEDVRRRALAVRNRRPRPARDDKVVAAWNGWAIASLAEAAMVHDRPAWLELATRAAIAVLDLHADQGSGRLARTSCDGTVSAAPGTAEDHAAMAHGCAVLAAATGEALWLDRAIGLLRQLDDHFAAEDGGLHDTADDAEALYLRPRELAENATPSATSAALRAARTVARLTGEGHWYDRADRLAHTMGALIEQAPRAAGWALHDAITELGARPAAEVAIVGAANGDADELVATAWRESPPGSVVTTGAGIPILQRRTALDGKATAYVCRRQVCRLPVTDLAALRNELVR